MQATYNPGSLVFARGREWIVLPESNAETLRLRPLGGGDRDETLIYLPLEHQPASLRPFRGRRWRGTQPAASQMLLDAMQLKLRNGAALPELRQYRSRASCLPARAAADGAEAARRAPLIADDVGIGKTIEGALIARELLDRGEIQRWPCCALRTCASGGSASSPSASTSRPSSCGRTPPTVWSVICRRVLGVPRPSLYRGQPGLHQVPAPPRSLPALLSRVRPRRGGSHLHAGGPGHQRRYQLLKGLAAQPERHLVLLAATPHSGDEEAFSNLLGLLRTEFTQLGTCPQADAATCAKDPRVISASVADPTSPSDKTPGGFRSVARQKSPTGSPGPGASSSTTYCDSPANWSCVPRGRDCATSA